ncbi:MAG: DUF4157 domain-containing protein, partial [Gemmatimonadaceae bacterium]|nr:DUF4157 domain-containing protein [Gemmatimonadaceae bacterium]NUQ92685.1 DUF4157 domain-containing protein [Gemmatimonadaceae bacterium]
PSLGPLGDVRVHRDAAAARAAASLDAVAFAAGRDVAFAEGRYAPETPGGKWLLAHEAAHVTQQRGGKAHVQRQPRGSVLDDPMARFGEGQAMADFDMTPPDSSDPTTHALITEYVVSATPTIEDPRTRRRRRDDETIALHSARIAEDQRITAYAVPISWLTRVPPARPTTQRPPAPPPPPVHEGEGEPPPSTEFSAGDVVYTPDGRALRVAEATADHVITFEYTKFAVGAGSATLVQTGGGIFLIDAGVGPGGGRGISRAVANRIAEIVGHGEIRGVFLTHLHLDHFAMLRRLRSLVPIREIAMSEAQRTAEQHDRLRRDVIAGEEEFLARERAARLADGPARARFVADLEREARPDQALDPVDVERRWGEHVDAEVAALPRTSEGVMMPNERGIMETYGTRPMHGPEGQPLRPSDVDIADARLIGISDPASAGVERLAEHQMDRFSTSFLIQTPAGTRIIVLGDLRASDMLRLRDNLMETLGSSAARYQIWEIGHHLQEGWAGQRLDPGDARLDAPGIRRTRAENLRNLLQLLHDARERGHGGTAGSDLITTSIDPNQLDLGTVELLRSMGFEIAPASNRSDVQLLEVMASTGERVTGYTGGTTLLPDTPATLERAHRARDVWTAEAETRRTRLETLPDDDAHRAERDRLTQEISDRTRWRDEMNALETSYRNAVDASRHGQTMADRHQPEAQAAREAREAIERMCTERGIPPVEVSSMRFTGAALLLIGRDPGQDPDPNTPEGQLRLRERAMREMRTRIETRLREVRAAATPDPAEVGTLYSDLREYETQLDALIAATPEGSSKTILLAERGRVTSMHQSMVVESAAEPTPSRLPTGELVETRVERVEAPPEPGRVARGMLGALEVTGRVMGAVMAVSSVTGSAELIDRYEQGTATTGQLVVGGAERITSGIVGLQMLRGARVGGAAFAAISILQVGEAALGHYQDTRDRNIAVTDTAIRGAVSLACMAIGEALIATMNPIGILAGAAIMFLGPQILDVLGLTAWLERKFGFLPEDVTGLHQDLRRLLDEYAIIAGAVFHAERDPEAMAEINVTDPVRARAAAEQVVLRHRQRAHELEPEILDGFDQAYRTARTSYAGLQELDSWRREFLEQQQLAWTGLPEQVPVVGEHQYPNPPAPPTDAGVALPGGTEDYTAGTPDAGVYVGPDGRPTSDFILPSTGDGGASGGPLGLLDLSGTVADTSEEPPVFYTEADRRRHASMARFAAIESRMSLSNMTADEVDRMDQWSQIHEGIANVLDALPSARRDGNWLDVRTKQSELRRMIDNARYRLDPSSFGDYRSTPLLAPGTDARREYERLLREAENRVQNAMSMVAYAPFAAQIGYQTMSGEAYDPVAQAEMEANGVTDRSSLFIPANPSEQPEWGSLERQGHVVIANDAYTTYTTVLGETPRPPQRFLDDNALYRDFSVLQDDYARYVRDDYVERMLARLEAIETSTDLAIGTAERIARADVAAGMDTTTVGGVDAISGGPPPLSHAEEDLRQIEARRREFNTRRSERKWRDGLIFPSEIAQLAAERRGLAVRSYGAALGAGGHPITAPEEAALRTGEFGAQGARALTDVGSIENRLMLVHDLRIPDAGGVVTGILRLDPAPVETRDTVKLVGVVETGYHTDYLWGAITTHHPWRVIALNTNAEAVLGDDAIHEVPTRRLMQALVSDLPLTFRLPESH